MGYKLGRQTTAKNWRIAAAVILALLMLPPLVFLYMGSDLHKGRGTPDESAYQAAILVYVFTYTVPTTAILVPWLSYRGWKDRLEDRIYVWQGILSLVLVIVTVVILNAGVIKIVVFDDYAKWDEVAQAEQPYCDMSVDARLSKLYAIVYAFWSITLLTSVFSSEPQSEKPKAKPRKPPTSTRRRSADPGPEDSSHG